MPLFLGLVFVVSPLIPLFYLLDFVFRIPMIVFLFPNIFNIIYMYINYFLH